MSCVQLILWYQPLHLFQIFAVVSVKLWWLLYYLFHWIQLLLSYPSTPIRCYTIYFIRSSYCYYTQLQSTLNFSAIPSWNFRLHHVGCVIFLDGLLEWLLFILSIKSSSIFLLSTVSRLIFISQTQVIKNAHTMF